MQELRRLDATTGQILHQMWEGFSMKKCPKCGMQYQDTESYCMECGKKLIKMEMSEMPPSELMSLISHV